MIERISLSLKLRVDLEAAGVEERMEENVRSSNSNTTLTLTLTRLTLALPSRSRSSGDQQDSTYTTLQPQ